jgi:hypothetical protein
MATEPDKAPPIEASYKAREVEGFLDLHFYRKIGYQLALICSRLQITPAQVTWAGAAIGITAGHLYYYRDVRVNFAGMLLQVLANIFDNADGQLARLTRKGSRSGRALDGLADHLVFVSIYAHLSLRYIAAGGSQYVWLLALAAGASHSWQSAAADYFRNAWLYFAKGSSGAELDSAASLQIAFDRLSWQDAPWKKFLLRLYLNYTRQQEWLSPYLSQLKQRAEETNDSSVAHSYLEASRSSIKLLNLLATNPRMILLFVLLFAGQPVWYFFAELSAFNLLLFLLLRRQRIICRGLIGAKRAVSSSNVSTRIA